MLFNSISTLFKSRRSRRASGGWFFVFVLLAIEFLDELVFGVREAAWPLIRTDLDLSYAQIGLLLGLPAIFGNLVEPLIGVLGDIRSRHALVVGGGIAFTVALLLTAGAPSFVVLLCAFVLFYPASGAFVSLSQASLMDLDPTRHEQLMARWTLAGSLGVVAGALALGVVTLLGWGWRTLFAMLAVMALLLTLLAVHQPFVSNREEEVGGGLRGALAALVQAVRRREVLRWLVLLTFSDLMLDILLGFLALYFVDVVGVSSALASSAVVIWVGVGLLGDALLIPLLERVRGLVYLRYSATAMLFLFPAFLLVPGWIPKVVLLGFVGMANAGWYAILKGQLYGSLPGRSGTVMAVSSAFGVMEGVVPVALGLVAETFGLHITMWLLLLGPVALLAGLPKQSTPAANLS